MPAITQFCHALQTAGILLILGAAAIAFVRMGKVFRG